MKRGTHPLSAFGANLIRLRTRAGWTQDDLADAAGVSRATVQRLETGKVSGPTSTVAAALAGALHVDTAELWRPAVVVAAPVLETAIVSFVKSPFAGVLRPPLSEEDLQRLRALAGSFWVGVRPTDEVLYHLVLAHRASHRQ